MVALCPQAESSEVWPSHLAVTADAGDVALQAAVEDMRPDGGSVAAHSGMRASLGWNQEPEDHQRGHRGGHRRGCLQFNARFRYRRPQRLLPYAYSKVHSRKTYQHKMIQENSL